MNNTGVTFLTAKKKTLACAWAVCNSAYAVNLTYDRQTTYDRHTTYDIQHTTYQQHYIRKMVPITGRASASFSSMVKLKRIGNE